jgi:hypothetical protein
MSKASKKPNRPAPIEALLELAVGKSAPDAALLDDLVRRYPEHAEELREAAVELALEAARNRLEGETHEDRVDTSSPAVAKAMARFRTRAAELEGGETREEAAPENPFLALDKTKARALAQRLHASTAFVMKLRDRLIRPETMSEGFQRRVAEEMSVPVELLAAHFAAPPQLAAGAYYKAEGRPQVGEKQTFEEAVKSSSLTTEQQAYLLEL